MKIRTCPRFLFCIICVWISWSSAAALAQLEQDTPTAIGPFLGGMLPSQNPNRPAGTWEVVPTSTHVSFPPTLAIEANPSNGHLWVGSLFGSLEAFDPNPGMSQKYTIVDLTDRVTFEGGLLGIAFHPEFGQANSPNRNFFFAYYASMCALNDQLDQVDMSRCVALPPAGNRSGFYGGYLRLSRFEYFEGASPQDVKNSETPMINIRLFNDSHRGGGPIFGNDGYMYLAIGEQEIPESAQDMLTNLHGGLRIAVNITEDNNGGWTCPVGTHLPRRTFQHHFNDNPNPDEPGHIDELSGQYYCIPDDNPWPDSTAAENFEEYFSIGHRNPHRITLDRVTGRIWSSEVGANLREEVNIISSGNNYGWPCREGFTDSRFSDKPYCQTDLIGDVTDPVIDFGRDEANALIGGYVYRGSRFPELYGKYLVGDWVLGHIYAITFEGGSSTATKTRLTTWQLMALSTWGQDLDGEIYLGRVGVNGPLHTLRKVTDITPEPPTRLFETGAFTDVLNLRPASYWLSYGLNQPFWSDGAQKRRWIAVPAGRRINFSDRDNWTFPVGTVIMKHFELPLDETDVSVTTRLETRFMVHGEDEWYGITYRWNDAQTDAVLLSDAESAEYAVVKADGSTRTQMWDFPSRSDCLFCHNSSVDGVAGIRTHLLNGRFTYPKSDITRNQLLAWNRLGLFKPALESNDISGYVRSVRLGNGNAALSHRARSWLDVNCSNCHRPGGPGDRAAFDLRLTTPLAAQNLVNGSVLESLGLPRESLVTPGCADCSVVYQRVAAVDEIAMPPLAKHQIDKKAVATLAASINSMDDVSPALGEAGTISIRQLDSEAWHLVYLENSYTNPVVVFGSMGNRGPQPAFSRVRNIKSGSFEFQVDEWTNQDGLHATEDLSYLVVESGTFTLADGRRLAAGISTNVNKFWKTVTFVQPFEQTPVVFSQVSSDNDPNPVIARQSLVSPTQFDIRLLEDEAHYADVRSKETVHWIAIEPGARSTGLEVGITSKSYNHEWGRIDFSQNHDATSPFFAAIQSMWGGDTAVLRHQNFNGSSVDVRVQEERTKDNEVTHVSEVIGFAVFPESGSIR